MHVKLLPLALGFLAWSTGNAVEARANKDLDDLAHAFPVVVILYDGQGHMVTSVSFPATMSNETEAYLHAYSVCRYPDLALFID
jgi:hypothetical protein